VASQTRNNAAFSFNGYTTVNRAYAANGLNQYTTAGPASFAYDGNGNLTSDGTYTYGYDAENKLVSASTSGGTTLTYDPLGRLYQTSSATYGALQRLYDGQHVVAEYNGAGGAMLRRYYWGPGADEPIVQDEGGALNCSGTRFLHTDDLGSIVATADCWGNQQAVNPYDEYGIIGSGGWGRYLYTGQAWVPDLGMLYYKARLYSPTLGRFMQTDPIGYGPNWYAYAHNNPVKGGDPSGLASIYPSTYTSGNLGLVTTTYIPLSNSGPQCCGTSSITVEFSSRYSLGGGSTAPAIPQAIPTGFKLSFDLAGDAHLGLTTFSQLAARAGGATSAAVESIGNAFLPTAAALTVAGNTAWADQQIDAGISPSAAAFGAGAKSGLELGLPFLAGVATMEFGPEASVLAFGAVSVSLQGTNASDDIGAGLAQTIDSLHDNYGAAWVSTLTFRAK
jgi:RHS repeat-associated protein